MCIITAIGRMNSVRVRFLDNQELQIISRRALRVVSQSSSQYSLSFP